MQAQTLENMLVDQPSIGTTIEVYTNGLAEMYSGLGLNNGVINVSNHVIDKYYGHHENKLIDYNTQSNTTVYSKFGQNGLRLDIHHNDFNMNHKKKILGYTENLDY